MALCFLQVLRETVVQYLAGSEQRIAPFWNIITWYPTLGVLGVIGPTRMAYEKIIPFVDATAKLLGAALNQKTSTPHKVYSVFP